MSTCVYMPLGKSNLFIIHSKFKLPCSYFQYNRCIIKTLYSPMY